MDEKVIEELGLTSGESKVYLALIKLGKSTAGSITSKAGVSSSKIYEILERLIEKGLVSYIIKGKVRYYDATEPQRLYDFLEKEKEKIEKKEKLLDSLIPALQKTYLDKQSKNKAEILEGIRGIKYFFDKSLEETKKGDVIFTVGYSKIASELFNSYFKQFHKKRAKKGIKARVIYDYETWFFKKREKRKFMEQQYLPKGIVTPTFIYIYNDNVGIITISEEQKMCFLIKNREVSESYKQYFEIMWKQSIKPK